MKNILKRIFFPLILFSSIFSQVALANPVVPEISGEGMILTDATTGKILASKNAYNQFAPASTTKVMTALLVLEKTKLSDIVTVGKNPPFAEGSSIGLKEGDQYTVEELLHGLLLESANDCAVALAEHVARTEENFAKEMNEKAKTLGAENTNFINSSGLFEDGHLTTPYDLSLIVNEASKNEEFVRISKVTSFELPESKVDGHTKWVNNLNSLIYPGNRNYYEDLIAGKTGYTTKSRFTYVAAAEKNGQKLIVTLFKYESKEAIFQDTINLFNYGFENFNLIKLYNKGDKVSSLKIGRNKEVPLLASEDIFYANEINSSNDSVTAFRDSLKPSFKLEEKDLSRQNLNQGDLIINSDLYLNNSKYTSLALASGVTVEYTLFDKVINHFLDYKYIYLAIATFIIGIFSYLFFKITRYRTTNYKPRFRKRNSKQLFGKSRNKYD
ncbi:MAG: serine hydrolase [Sarcina sp.]